MDKILLTGGAGFVGSCLALGLKKHFPKARIVALDNLKRRGSELNISRLKSEGVEFIHGDVRSREDIRDVGPFDILVDCAAEPSVLAGITSNPDYVIQTNLGGTLNVLEAARSNKALTIFLSTSRVYPIATLNSLRFTETATRFSMQEHQEISGASGHGIAEDFPLPGLRSIYGATKLSSEFLLQEYIGTYGLSGVINRCGVLAGPWQMATAEQGVVGLWIARLFFNKELAYIGYGGTGKQVRDVLHVEDLLRLILIQISAVGRLNGQIYNVGGGVDNSVSLSELTELCARCVQRKVQIKQVMHTRPNDIKCYISDCRKAQKDFGWKPTINPAALVEEVYNWIKTMPTVLEPLLG